ncbi:unnamed protein product [Fusarium graminearum]|uniref:Chromosome 1, complete genome n=1 Tax=Gibberella zeae (strain ATCC MYA-4620 / CBS 123657 / FGSC 9075 / NRRL 31084 / PH-1) TaxID=229533 RepID=A0A098DAB5_GIBZE|nr:unnamed protein product [Fusarium graminearum]
MDDKAIELQLSRIISASEYTTIFTTIVPKPTAKADATATTEIPVVTVTQEAAQSDVSSGGLPGGKIFGALEIIIALGVLVGVLLLIMGIILCDRRRKSKKRKRASSRVQKRMGEKNEPVPDTSSQVNRSPTDTRVCLNSSAASIMRQVTYIPATMCAAVVPMFIGSLSAEAIRILIQEHGYDASQWIFNAYVQWKTGQAATQHTRTMEDVQHFTSDLKNIIERKEIRVVPDAFNSTPNFIGYFQTAALGAIPLAILDVGQAIRRVGASLESIRSELAIANVSTVQGWDGGGFGSYVHRFVRNEMSAFDDNGVDKGGNYQYFYVWHPDTDWYTAFEERQAEQPLGPSFGGYHHDLVTICLRMRADREALKATTEHGITAVLHLVIPAYQPLVVDTEFKFAEELFPLIVTGARHRGIDLVWLALDQPTGDGRLELRLRIYDHSGQDNMGSTR